MDSAAAHQKMLGLSLQVTLPLPSPAPANPDGEGVHVCFCLWVCCVCRVCLCVRTCAIEANHPHARDGVRPSGQRCLWSWIACAPCLSTHSLFRRPVLSPQSTSLFRISTCLGAGCRRRRRCRRQGGVVYVLDGIKVPAPLCARA